MDENRFWPFDEKSKALKPGFEAYTFWLLSDLMSDGGSTYYFLGMVLNEIEAYCVVQDDENRMRDGVGLRKGFNDIYPEYDIFNVMSSGCTVLELLVALSSHMAQITYYPGDDESAWFWIMLENLDIKISDKEWPKQDSLSIIRDNVRKWLDRKFSKKGKGSPWPMKKCSEDLRHIPMWEHMQWFLGEILEGV